MRPLRSALGRNVAALLTGQAVTLLVQLGAVPVLTACWGVERFGVWLLLSAIPAYLVLSDFGFTVIAKNDMAMRVAAGDRRGAGETFQSVLVLLILAAAVLAPTGLAAVAYAPLDALFDLGAEPLSSVRAVLAVQALSVLAYPFCLLFYAGVRCEGRAATETLMAAAFRALDAAAVMAVALLGGGLVAAAAAGLLLRLVNVVALAAWLARTTPWLTLGVGGASRSRLAALAAPALGYLLVPITNAALIQGPIVALGATSSPATVALFAVTRTVARLGTTAANLLNYAFTPEYSFAAGRRDRAGFLRLLRGHLVVLLVVTILFAGVMVVGGDRGIWLLSRGAIAPVPALTLLLVAGACLEMLWSGGFSPLLATNGHGRIASVLACGAIVSIGAAILAGSGPVPLALAVAAAHAVAAAAVALSLAGLLERLRRW